MRKVIVNSTPLIVLCSIGRLEILQKMYAEITIPAAVYREVTEKEDISEVLEPEHVRDEIRKTARGLNSIYNG